MKMNCDTQMFLRQDWTADEMLVSHSSLDSLPQLPLLRPSHLGPKQSRLQSNAASGSAAGFLAAERWPCFAVGITCTVSWHLCHSSTWLSVVWMQ